MSTSQLLEQGIQAAQAGRREQARALLTKVVEADERNEQAWLWLAGMVDDPADMRTCLENVLDLNPGNAKAQQGLAWIEKRYGPRPAAASAPSSAAPHSIEAPHAAAPPMPAGGATYTGPTTKLIPPAAVPLTGAPAAAPAQLQAEAPENPCPYCGAPTMLSQERCAQCHNSLMLRGTPRATRSVPLTILGILWMISGVLQLLGGLAALVLGLIAFSSLQSQMHRLNPKASVPFPTQIFLPLVVGLVVGGITIAIGRGLLRRERWAYIITLAFTVIGVLAVVLAFVLTGGSLVALIRLPSGSLPPDAAYNLGVASAPLIAGLLVGLAVQALYVLLVGLSYRDFFGPMVRFQPELSEGDHVEHYNSGVAYKDRGMWHIAAREWEAAIKLKSRDSTYLHALGLAYAQLGRFDQARTTLDTATQVAPDNQQIKESRELVERMAGRTQKS
jgi:tetratricopeptide (TPR) repeat protein